MTRILGEDPVRLAAAGLNLERLRAIERDVEAQLELPPGPRLDAHVHLGRDADGHELSPDGLIADLDRFAVDTAVAFPANDPGSDGTFTVPNTMVLDAARQTPDRIIPFVRLDPATAHEGSLVEWHARGARGLKLHPVAQHTRPEGPETVALVSAAGELGIPVLIHAGFGARPLAEPLLALTAQCPRTDLILAHGGRGDARALRDAFIGNPRVAFDTSLATIADLVELPPDQLVFGSDRPYGDLLSNLVLVAGAARHAGWTEGEFAGVLGGNLVRFFSR